MNKGQIIFFAGLILVIIGIYALFTPRLDDDVILKFGPISGMLLGYGLRDMMSKKA